MAKRDHDTELWSEDWFLNLSDSEMLFWFYIKDKCDHAGFWRPNFFMFEKITGRRINQQEFLNKMNSDKKRIEVLENGKWFITGYIAFQFCGSLNINNKFHASVLNTFRKNVNCENTSIYGFEVKETSRRPLPDLNKERITNNEERDINTTKDSIKEEPFIKDIVSDNKGGAGGGNALGKAFASVDLSVFKDDEPKNGKAGSNIPPKEEEVKKYCDERKNGIKAVEFIDYYSARGWMLGKCKMKNWQAAIRTWEKNKKDREPVSQYRKL